MTDTGFHLSFYLLCVVLLWLALRGILGGRTVFEYPTLAAMMGLAWVVPQGLELESDPYNYYTSDAFWLYVTGCYLFIYWGFQAGRKAEHRRIVRAPERVLRGFSMKRLVIASAGLTALGLLAIIQMRDVDTSGMGGEWTGIITMWFLLAKATGFGLCLAVLIFARTRSLTPFIIAFVAALPIVHGALFGVGRELLFDLVILTAGAWYLVKGKHPPRGVIIVCLLVGTVLLNSAGEIRQKINSGEESMLGVLTSTETYLRFDFFNLGQGSASEVGFAQYDFWHANQSGSWELGADHWNKLVHQYVPAFLLGQDFKQGLKISTLRERLRHGEEEGAFSLGSTRTGFSDSYRGFGLFGVLVFGVIGYGFGFLYASAAFGGMSGQYFYLVLLAEGMKAITHSTAELLAALPFTIILSLAVLRLAKVNPCKRVSRPVRIGSSFGPRYGVTSHTDVRR